MLCVLGSVHVAKGVIFWPHITLLSEPKILSKHLLGRLCVLSSVLSVMGLISCVSTTLPIPNLKNTSLGGCVYLPVGSVRGAIAMIPSGSSS